MNVAIVSLSYIMMMMPRNPKILFSIERQKCPYRVWKQYFIGILEESKHEEGFMTHEVFQYSHKIVQDS